MATHNLPEKLTTAKFAGDPKKLIFDSEDNGFLLGIGTNANQPTAAEWARGALWVEKDGTGTARLLVNTGDAGATPSWSAISASGSHTKTANLDLNDDVFIRLGSSQDVTIEWDTASTPDCLIMLPKADDTVWQVGNGTTDFDLMWYMGDAAKYIKLDASDWTMYFVGTKIVLDNDSSLQIGSTSFRYDGTYVEIAGTNQGLEIGNDSFGIDLLWHGAAASAAALFDASDNRVELDGIDLVLQDDDMVQFGDDADVTMAWDGGNFNIRPKVTNTGVFTIGSNTLTMDFRVNMDSTADYVLFDQDAQLVYLVGTDLRFGDDDILELGTGGIASLLWETADPNANALLLELPAGGGVDVPVFAIGIGIENVDLGFFNGLTQPTFAIIDADRDSYLKIDWSADDVARIAVAGTATTIGIVGSVALAADNALQIGATGAQFIYETADANANALTLVLPTGGGTDVTALVICEETDLAQDITFFNGITQPTVCIVDTDSDSWIKLGYSGDDTPILHVGGGSSSLNMLSDTALQFGGVGAQILYETADTNANALTIVLPTGGGTDVTALVLCEETDLGADLTFFNGVANTTLGMVDADSDSWLKFGFSADDVFTIDVGGTCAMINIADTVQIATDMALQFAATGAQIIYETADGNAHALTIVLPTGGANDVTALVICEETDLAGDLTFFNGITNPTICIVDTDSDSWIKFGFSADDTPFIDVGGASSTLTISDDVLLADNIGVNFGTGTDAEMLWNATYLQLGPASGMWAGAPAVCFISQPNSTGVTYHEFFCDFTGLWDANEWTINTIENGGAATEVIGDTVAGALIITNAPTDNDADQITYVNETFQLATGKKLWFEARLTLSEATEIDFFIGLIAAENLTAVADSQPADGVGWSKNDDDTNLDFVSSKDGTHDASAAQGTLNTSAHVYAFYWDGTDTITPYLDGVAKTAVNTTICEDEAFAFAFMIRNGNGVARIATLDYVRVVQLR